jgi:2-(1,2-epoxy-1,2-dihydrophenyl)acetyl-CoA isomerase
MELGLSLDTVGADRLLATAREYAAALADLPTDALVTTRQLIRQAAGTDFDTALATERSEQDRLGRSAEHAEGVSAFSPGCLNPKPKNNCWRL